MTMAAAGVAKLIEEMGELHQVLGKKLAWWDTDEPHWDGTVLSERMQDEMGDVLAAIWFAAEQLGLDKMKIGARQARKTMLFGDWQDELDNNDHGIDGQFKLPDPATLPYVIIPPGKAGVVMWTGKDWVHVGTEPPA